MENGERGDVSMKIQEELTREIHSAVSAVLNKLY